jgi:hypothetical protein
MAQIPTNVDQLIDSSMTAFSVYGCDDHDVRDFTKRRLSRYALSRRSKEESLKVIALLEEYVARRVAIAWLKGKPMFIPVERRCTL